MAMRIMGVNITNTAVLGAVVKASGAVKLDSVLAVVKERFQGKVKDQNLEVVETAYREAVKG
jgi:Pyruvate/2-oxoacid:ferredoxin oxidoreductase gamma subunit